MVEGACDSGEDRLNDHKEGFKACVPNFGRLVSFFRLLFGGSAKVILCSVAHNPIGSRQRLLIGSE